MAVHAHADRAQERLGDRAAGHPRRGLAGAGALEDVADVAEAVLLGADEVGVTGTGQVDLGRGRLDRPWVHPLLPIGVVAVVDLQGDRTAERAPVPDSAGDLHLVALDLHPSPTPVAELTAGQIAVDGLAIELEAGGKTLDDAGQSGAMGLPGGGHA